MWMMYLIGFFAIVGLGYILYVLWDWFQGISERYSKEYTYDVVHECWYYNYDKDNPIKAVPVKKVCSTWILSDQKVQGLKSFEAIRNLNAIEKDPKYKQKFVDSTMRGLDHVSSDWMEKYDGYLYITKYYLK